MAWLRASRIAANCDSTSLHLNIQHRQHRSQEDSSVQNVTISGRIVKLLLLSSQRTFCLGDSRGVLQSACPAALRHRQGLQRELRSAERKPHCVIRQLRQGDINLLTEGHTPTDLRAHRLLASFPWRNTTCQQSVCCRLTGGAERRQWGQRLQSHAAPFLQAVHM